MLLIGSRLVTEFSGDGASAEFADPGECSAVTAEVPQRLGGSRLRGEAVDGDDRADAVEIARKQLPFVEQPDAEAGEKRGFMEALKRVDRTVVEQPAAFRAVQQRDRPGALRQRPVGSGEFPDGCGGLHIADQQRHIAGDVEGVHTRIHHPDRACAEAVHHILLHDHFNIFRGVRASIAAMCHSLSKSALRRS